MELEKLSASLGRDAARAPDLGRLTATADALAGPFALERRLTDKTRPGLGLDVSLCFRLRVVVGHDVLAWGHGGIKAMRPMT